MSKQLNDTSTQRSGLYGIVTRIFLSEYFVLMLTVVYFLIVWIFVPWLGNTRNLSNILSNTWPLLAVAIGETFVLIVAGIDLSQVAIMAVTSVVSASVITEAVDPILFSKSPLWGTVLTEEGGLLAGNPMAIPFAILLVLVIGTAIGALNGTSVAIFKMPPFIVTLVSFMFFGAVAIYLTKSENIMNLPEEYVNISNEYGGVFSLSMVISVGLAILAYIILSKTILGRWMYATGMNEKAARISGVPTAKITIFAYAFSGFAAAVASMLYSSRLQAGRPVLGGLPLILDIVGANIIGGMSLQGGKGKVTWTIFGVLFFVVLSNTLNQMNLDSFSINVVKGAVILAAAVIDVTRNRLTGRQNA